MWVFDDSGDGLSAEPFVGGADTMIDRVTRHIPDAERGFNVVFPGIHVPDHQHHLQWQKEEGTGDVYHVEELGAEGRLCPVLLRCFDERPSNVHVQVKSKTAST